MTAPTVLEGRGLRVGLMVVVAVAAAGFFTGTRGTPPRLGYRDAETAATTNLARAPRQRDMEAARYAKRRGEIAVSVTEMSKPPRTVLDAVTRDEDDYLRAIEQRMKLRAYDGAPPIIPHAIDQHGAPACLTCHGSGLKVRDKVAKPMSHPAFSSCTQCHVTREGPLASVAPLSHSVSTETTFLGLMPKTHGTRGLLTSPPVMPHREYMRERCTSCHGVWAEGLKSTHPARQSCEQCHAMDAASEQMPVSTLIDLSPLGASQ